MDVFTLVSISIERYLAICHPFIMLRIQSMQNASLLHAFMLLIIWTVGLLTALPNYFLHELCFLPTLRRSKCERGASKHFDERIYVTSIAGNTPSYLKTTDITFNFSCSSLLLDSHDHHVCAVYINHN